MKIFAGLFFFCFVQVVAAQKKETAPPVLKMDTAVIDIGNIPYGWKGNKDITFTNSGGSPLLIKKAISQCSCLKVLVPAKPVKPGGSGVITLQYDTHLAGAFYKSVVLFTNASNSVIKIYIKGRVDNPPPGTGH
jgi:hypothetical protein